MPTVIEESPSCMLDITNELISTYMVSHGYVQGRYQWDDSVTWCVHIKRNVIIEMLFDEKRIRQGEIIVSVSGKYTSVTCLSQNTKYTEVCAGIEHFLRKATNQIVGVSIITEYCGEIVSVGDANVSP